MIVDLYSHKEAAKIFRVKPQLVSFLVTSTLKNRRFLADRKINDDKKVDIDRIIQMETLKILRVEGILSKASQVKNAVKEQHGIIL